MTYRNGRASTGVPTLTRRQFLGAAGVATAGVALAGSRKAAASVGANDRVRLALIGTGGMGNRHLDSLVKNQRCEVVALCDVWKRRVDGTADRIAPAVGKRPDVYQDFRRVLERPDIDAVFVATPDHWHPLIAILACQARKDVYVEKPLSPTIAEGRAVVEAARRYGRVVQVGTQQRSQALFQNAVEVVHSGKLGAVTTAAAWIGPNAILPDAEWYETPENPPDDLDWDMWLGPTPWYPYSRGRHEKWYCRREYSGREITNWGPHLFDVVLWGIGQDRPLSVQGVSGNYMGISGMDGRQDVAMLYEFPGCTVAWEQRSSNTFKDKGYGMRFHGTTGRLLMDRVSCVVEPAGLGIPETFEKGDPWIDVDTHHNNFFDCIVSRDKPNADVEIGHRATTMCNLGSIATDLGRKLVWDGDAERFINDEQANRHLYRPYRAPWHL